MPAARTTDTETLESGPDGNARDVHSPLPGRILPGAKALHHLQPRIPHSRIPDMLQWRRELHILGQLRGPSM